MSYPIESKKERFSTWGGPQTGPKEETEDQQIDVEDPGRKNYVQSSFHFTTKSILIGPGNSQWDRTRREIVSVDNYITKAIQISRYTHRILEHAFWK